MALMTLIILLSLMISWAWKGIHLDIQPVGADKIEILAPGKDPIGYRNVL